MIIQHNIMAINSHRSLGVNNVNLQNNLEKLSSGYKINKAADDAAGLAISEKMRAQITGLDRAILNAQDASSFIQVAEGAMTEIHSMLNRMQELAVQASNGIYDSIDRGQIQQELEALSDEVDRISQATNFNGIAQLNGNDGVMTDAAPTTGKTTFTFQVGDTAHGFQQIAVSISSMDATSLGVKFSATETDAGSGTISMVDEDNALDALAAIRSAIDTVSTQRGILGAAQNRLEHTINNLGVTSENMTASESRIRDSDMAKEMMSFTKNNVLSQAAQSMLAQANTQPQQVLQLLR